MSPLSLTLPDFMADRQTGRYTDGQTISQTDRETDGPVRQFDSGCEPVLANSMSSNYTQEFNLRCCNWVVHGIVCVCVSGHRYIVDTTIWTKERKEEIASWHEEWKKSSFETWTIITLLSRLHVIDITILGGKTGEMLNPLKKWGDRFVSSVRLGLFFFKCYIGHIPESVFLVVCIPTLSLLACFHTLKHFKTGSRWFLSSRR